MMDAAASPACLPDAGARAEIGGDWRGRWLAWKCLS
jgi:hypothetical protein